MDKNENAVHVFNKHAKLYQDKFMDVNLYGDSFNFFCDNIEQRYPEILDVACGPGNITKYLLTKRADLNILGIDLSANMIDLAKVNNPTAEFMVKDCRNIGLLEKKYDAIMCGFFLPYLSKEEAIKFIIDAAKMIRISGLLYISTMEDDYSVSGLRKGSTGDEIYMHYHQADYLTSALEENRFTLVFLDRKEYPGPDATKTTDLIIIAKKEEELI